MNTSKIPGPICQIWRWHDIRDGTLARTSSQAPSTTGMTGYEGAWPVNGTNANSPLGTQARPFQNKVKVSS
jgi:hypothetical protein